MELFTLGRRTAAAYTENDIREAARGADRLAQRLVDAELGAYNFRFDPNRHDNSTKTSSPGTPFGKRQLDWTTPAGSASSTRSTRRSSSRSCGATSSRRRRRRDTQAALESLYTSSGYAIRPVRRGDPDAPRLLPRARRWSSRRSSTWPSLLRAIGRYVDTDDWIWLADNAGQQLFYPPNVSGWDDNRWLDTSRCAARWLLATYALEDDATSTRGTSRLRRRRGSPAPRSTGRSAPGTTRRCASSTRTSSLSFANNAWAPAPSAPLAEEPLPRHAPERPAAADRRLPRHAARLRPDRWPRPQLLQQLHPLPAAAHGRRRGRQGAAGDRDRDADARRHGPLPALVPLAQRRAGARGLRRDEAAPRRPSRRGSRMRPTNGRVLVSRLLRRRHRLDERAGADRHSQYAGLRPDPRAGPSEGTAFTRGPDACAGIPPPRRCATLHGEGKVTRLPGDRLHEPQPVPLHLASLLRDRRARGRRPHRLAGPLHRPHGRRRQPAPGALPGRRRSRPTLATADEAGGRGRDPTDYDMWTHGSGDPIERRHVPRASATSAASPRTRRR